MRPAAQFTTTLSGQFKKFVDCTGTYGASFNYDIPCSDKINNMRTILLSWLQENSLLGNPDANLMDEVLDKEMIL